MSKCFLVMDMPSSCRKCDLRVIGSVNFCTGAGCRKIDQIKIINEGTKPDWCPLKPIPSKKDKPTKSESVACFNSGYNACIDELLGGEHGSNN